MHRTDLKQRKDYIVYVVVYTYVERCLYDIAIAINTILNSLRMDKSEVYAISVFRVASLVQTPT